MSVLSSSAMAGIVYFSPITAWQDDSLDYVVDSGAGNVGTIGIGDRIISVAEFDNSQGVLAGQGPDPFAPGNEITAIVDITVTNVLGDGTLVFGASGASGILSSFTAGTVIAFYNDTSPDVNVINAACGTRAQCIALASGVGDPNSSLFYTAGFYGDGDESWTSSPQANGATISVVENGGSSSVFGTFNYQLSVANNNSGITFGPISCGVLCGTGLGADGFVQVSGSGNILGGQFLDHAQWTARDDADHQFNPVPEPTILGLLGAGILAWGYRRRTQIVSLAA
jgi:hypothetical protein